MHILVIDDDYRSGRVLELMLRRQYHTVTLMGEFDDVESLRGSLDEIQPEGVILDFGMKHEGDTIYRWIKDWWRDKNKRRELPVVFYTCYAASPDIRGRMIGAGAKEHEIVRKTEVGNDIHDLLMVLTWSTTA